MFTASIYIKNNEINAALFDENFSNIGTASASCEINCQNAANLCEELLSKCGVKANDVRYVSVATPNICDTSALQERINIKCARIAPIQARALGEAFLASDKEFFVVLKIDDSVQSGVVIDRSVIDSDLGQTVIDFNGYDHTGGRKGSIQAYLCREGFSRICADAGVKDASTISPAELFAQSSTEANAAKMRYVEYIAAALTNIINLFQPNGLIVDAFFNEAGDAITAPVMDIVLREQYSRSMENKCAVSFTCGEEINTVLLGAALKFRQR